MIKTLFNNNWNFTKQSINTDMNYILANKKTLNFNRIDIPHDWLIYQTKDLYETSLGVYTKDFTLTKATDKVYELYFEGIYFNCDIYINNTIAFSWKYGYSSFYFNITDYINDGENNITVFVYHEAPNSRWYSGAGIYRPVYLFEYNKTHIATDGIYFSTIKTDNGYIANISTEICNFTDNLSVKHTISDSASNIIAKTDFIKLQSDNDKCSLPCPNVTEWSHDNPCLYSLTTELFSNDILLDSITTTIGFRSFSFTPEGLFVNGSKVKLNGVCLHHDLGCLGAAVNKEATRRQLLSMKEMGANAIRTSHNMPSKFLMELCDEIGLYVNSEAFDIWQLKKNEFDYARFFDNWHEKDIKSWIKRDRNHASVIMWSIGNEIYDTHSNKNAPELTAHLKALVELYDPLHNALSTIGSNYIPWEGAQKCADILKLSGYNYCENLYEEHHKKFSDHIIYGSETAARVQSRGIYHFPITTAVKTHVDLQCSSLENSRSGIGDRTPQSSIIWDRDTDFSCGQFIWTGSDYIGEPTPYKTKNSYYGQIDTAGLKKDSYYLYESCWTDKPVLHLFPYWDFNEGEIIDVCAYTNQPEVELFFNGKSIGKRQIDVKHGSNLMASWRVPYSYGEIKAVAYDKNGTIILTDSHHSFGDSKNIILKADKSTMLANGEDMIFVEISTTDADGYPVENARDRVFVNVEGCGRLVGLDSGDSTDYEEYKGTSKKLFSGKLVAYIAATTKAGEITVSVSGNGLKSAKLNLQAIQTTYSNGISCLENNQDQLPEKLINQIPARKIELTTTTTALNSDIKECTVTANILPANASDKELKWIAVTETGVETNIAEIIPANTSCKVNAIGDGNFILRCMLYNGKSAPEIISELFFTIEGLGMATLNPYNFIYGTLYKDSSILPGEDLEGGISPKINSYVGFSKCDFGISGTDTFILPMIYWFSSDPLKVSIWSGVPHASNSKLIGSNTYSHEFVWATYFDLVIKTKKPIKAVHDIYFEFELNKEAQEQRISFKGFSCTKINRAYERINVSDNISIYGDSFKLGTECIEHIGNNVSIEFDEMDFTDGISSITIYGRTSNEMDSMHIFFIDEEGRKRRLIEFTKSSDFKEMTFPIENLKGCYKVNFMFLPGSDFDFAWFKFNR